MTSPATRALLEAARSVVTDGAFVGIVEGTHTCGSMEALRAAIRACEAEEDSPYNELIMAVARKFPGETRHQTALRYIQEAEMHCTSSKPQQESPPASEA